MLNIYSTPEKFGLTVVASIDLIDESYSFDIRVVWKTESGKLLTARDYGCSCPIPFEEVSLEDLVPVNLDELENEIRNSMASLSERDSFIRKVIQATKR